MRDLLLVLLVFGAAPVILMRPYVGVLMWSWLAYLNPHRHTWSFAFDFPFSQVAAIATLAGLVMTREDRRLPWQPATVVLLLLTFWFTVTTVFALNQEGAWYEWDRSIKIMLFTFITLMLIKDRQRINLLIWVIVLSFGFYGGKGGLFAILEGGQYRVWGPPGTFFEDNNALALALIMVLPLMRYAHLHAPRRWIGWGMLALMALTGLAILASYSRGAFLAAAAMVFFLWWKSRYKLRMGAALLAAAMVGLAYMPDKWFERMDTIKTFEQDESAMGRINAWWFAWNLALDRPIVGGGFQTFTREAFQDYAPDPEAFHDSHSIYFEILGEQGFVGLVLFLTLGTLTILTAGKASKLARGDPSLAWARDLGAMLQVSLVGYAVGGAFLGLAYFDLYYHLVAIAILLRYVVEQELAAREQERAEAGAAPSEPGWRPFGPPLPEAEAGPREPLPQGGFSAGGLGGAGQRP